MIFYIEAKILGYNVYINWLKHPFECEVSVFPKHLSTSHADDTFMMSEEQNIINTKEEIT